MPGYYEQLRVSQILQVCADSASSNTPARFIVALRDQEFLFRAEVWTSAMTREFFTLDWSLSQVASAQAAFSGAVSWENAAGQIVEDMIGGTIRVQADRWRLAQAQGLSRDRGIDSLPASKILIDPTLLRLLDAEEIDVRRLATLFACDHEFQVGDEAPSFTAGTPTNRIFSRQIGLGLPVASKWFRICSNPVVLYDGTYLALDGDIPDAVMASAPGRRLGDLIATGFPDLNARVITAIHLFGDHPHGITLWEETKLNFIELTPEHIELGDPL